MLARSGSDTLPGKRATTEGRQLSFLIEEATASGGAVREGKVFEGRPAPQAQRKVACAPYQLTHAEGSLPSGCCEISRSAW